MANHLPYFKFNANQWITGDICLENKGVQGVFIGICAFYWSKGCDISMEKVMRFLPSEDHSDLKQLIQSGVIKVDKKKNIRIQFLDEQLEENSKKSAKNSSNGRNGGAPKGNRNAAKEELKDTELENNPKTSEKQATNTTENQPKTSHKEKRREEKIYIDFVGLVNSFTKKRYRGDKKSEGQFNARTREGYTEEDFSLAIKSATEDPYHKETGFRYLTPEFLTRSDKLEKFLNAGNVASRKEEIKNHPNYDKNKQMRLQTLWDQQGAINPEERDIEYANLTGQ